MRIDALLLPVKNCYDSLESGRILARIENGENSRLFFTLNSPNANYCRSFSNSPRSINRRRQEKPRKDERNSLETTLPDLTIRSYILRRVSYRKGLLYRRPFFMLKFGRILEDSLSMLTRRSLSLRSERLEKLQPKGLDYGQS